MRKVRRISYDTADDYQCIIYLIINWHSHFIACHHAWLLSFFWLVFQNKEANFECLTMEEKVISYQSHTLSFLRTKKVHKLRKPWLKLWLKRNGAVLNSELSAWKKFSRKRMLLNNWHDFHKIHQQPSGFIIIISGAWFWMSNGLIFSGFKGKSCRQNAICY